MFKKELIISLLVVFFSFGLVGAVFAENNDTSILGRDEFSFDAQLTSSEQATQQAALNYNYNQDRLAQVGTEAGNSQYRFDSSTLSAQTAAMDHEYNQKSLIRGATEAGNWEARSGADAVCSNC